MTAAGGMLSFDELFRRFVDAHPDGYSRSAYSSIDERAELRTYRVQPWPTLLSPSEADRLAKAGLGLSALLRSLPRRVFGNDPKKLAEFYGLESELHASLAFAEPNGVAGALSRGDFIQTAAGWKCIEFNLGSHIGGWYVPSLGARYWRVPILARFLEESGLRLRRRNNVQAVLAHVAREARENPGFQSDGEINLAVTVPASKEIYDDHLLALLNREYRAMLASTRLAREGMVLFVDYADLVVRGGLTYHGQRKIHAVLEQHNGMGNRDVFRCFKAGKVNLYTGPATLLSDKRNVALLSELEDSSRFTPEEKAVIREHVPWTRRFLKSAARYRGEEVCLPSLAETRREHLVLKHGQSSSGLDVWIGRDTPPERWREVIGKALADGRWVLQEYQEPLTRTLQMGDHGSGPYDIVWGVFVFGSTYGDSYLRMIPKGQDGVLNVARGAQVGLVFEVAETA